MTRHQHGGNIYQYNEITDFSANINPLGMPESVSCAARAGIEQSIHYPEAGSRALTEAIAAFEKEHYVLCGNGAAELIFLMCQVICPAGAVILQPTFAEYGQALSACGSQITELPLEESDDFKVTEKTVNALKNVILKYADTENAIQMVFLCQPNNPTGQLIEQAYLETVLAICREHRVWLVLDACFTELLEKEKSKAQHRLIKGCLAYEQCIVLKAFTKSYGMAGLRLGYLMCRNPELIAKLQMHLQPWNISLPAQMAGMAALSEKDFLKRSRYYIEEEKQWLLMALEKMKSAGMIEKIYGHAANYIFFKAVKGLQEMLIEKGILIRDCNNYAGLTEGYYRIAVRTHAENVKLIEAFEQLVLESV